MRTPSRLLSVFLLLVVCAGWAPQSLAQEMEPPGHRVLIGFPPAAELQVAQDRADIVAQAGGIVYAAFKLIPVVSAWVPVEGLAALANRPDVAYVEEDPPMYAFAQSTPWGVSRIHADLVWPGGNTGAGVEVAIIDTGIDSRHPDLAVVDGINYAGPPEKEGSTDPADWNDGYGHGTHCAGIVAALNNGIGVVGVAPGVRLHAVKVLDNTGLGYTSDIIQGLEWCVQNHVQVASLSLGGGGSTSLQEACDKAFAAGVLLVAAAGNSSGPVRFPAGYPSVVAVSATDSQDRLAYFSSFGPEIALGAPGVDIYSTCKGGSYTTMSGTSMACPHVTGTAALVWAAGAVSNVAVRDTLTRTAEDLPPAGRDPSFGYGLADAQKAAGIGKTTVQITNPADRTTVSGIVTIAATAHAERGIAGVEFFLDTTSIGLGAPGADGWSRAWDTTLFHDSAYQIVAVAHDALGQTARHSINVVVDNASKKPPEPTTMHVSAMDMWGTKISKGYLIQTKVVIVDSSLSPQPVPGAVVVVTTTRPNGRSTRKWAVTGSEGAALLSIWSNVGGTFTSTVTAVTDSLVYDPSANRETTDSCSVP
ncbi:MAG: S8 family serine peptidase [Planctomycetes bacterium]|nr:S8 family serine peptidase [Planctomycetota bacterium]